MLFTVADVEDLSNQIRTLWESPELRAKLGRQARARVVRDYDMARNTQKFATVLADYLPGTRRTA
jgi:glycosyltransferase involved in cell wall biosynthesis